MSFFPQKFEWRWLQVNGTAEEKKKEKVKKRGKKKIIFRKATKARRNYCCWQPNLSCLVFPWTNRRGGEDTFECFNKQYLLSFSISVSRVHALLLHLPFHYGALPSGSPGSNAFPFHPSSGMVFNPPNHFPKADFPVHFHAERELWYSHLFVQYFYSLSLLYLLWDFLVKSKWT